MNISKIPNIQNQNASLSLQTNFDLNQAKEGKLMNLKYIFLLKAVSHERTILSRLGMAFYFFFGMVISEYSHATEWWQGEFIPQTEAAEQMRTDGSCAANGSSVFIDKHDLRGNEYSCKIEAIVQIRDLNAILLDIGQCEFSDGEKLPELNGRILLMRLENGRIAHFGGTRYFDVESQTEPSVLLPCS